MKVVGVPVWLIEFEATQYIFDLLPSAEANTTFDIVVFWDD